MTVTHGALRHQERDENDRCSLVQPNTIKGPNSFGLIHLEHRLEATSV